MATQKSRVGNLEDRVAPDPVDRVVVSLPHNGRDSGMVGTHQIGPGAVVVITDRGKDGNTEKQG